MEESNVYPLCFSEFSSIDPFKTLICKELRAINHERRHRVSSWLLATLSRYLSWWINATPIKCTLDFTPFRRSYKTDTHAEWKSSIIFEPFPSLLCSSPPCASFVENENTSKYNGRRVPNIFLLKSFIYILNKKDILSNRYRERDECISSCCLLFLYYWNLQ